MASVDMCEHEWPGTGCEECKAGPASYGHIDQFGELASSAVSFSVPATAQPAPQSERSGWISVEDRLPDPGQIVLAAIRYSNIPVLLRKNGPSPNPNRGEWDYLDGDTCRKRIDHWMPLPAAPAMAAQGDT